MARESFFDGRYRYDHIYPRGRSANMQAPAVEHDKCVGYIGTPSRDYDQGRSITGAVLTWRRMGNWSMRRTGIAEGAE